ncbi:MAG TPA: hypothetical protein VMM36_04240 [Opitutaceae bacterium]|nr:hypothetical protein [Opitutaceae bacterium]
MKTHLFGMALIAALVSTTADLHATGSYTLETEIYVFRNSEVRATGISADSALGEDGGVVFQSPAVVQFGEVSLSLDGSRFSWSSGMNPPDRFTRVETPNASLLSGKPVALLFTSPVQYLEKVADGSLQVREIPGDSPDAPHWRLSFKLKREADESGDFAMECEVDVASVISRESMPGVRLPVGKPVLARFNETLQLGLSAEEWSALVVRAPGDGDYTMVTLLRVLPGEVLEKAGGSDQLMTAQEFVVFATYYYQNPQPKRIAHAIESLASNGFLESSVFRSSSQVQVRTLPGDQLRVVAADQARMAIVVGFWAKVFELNPEMMSQWKALIDRKGQDAKVQFWLRTALTVSQAGVKPGVPTKEFDGLNEGRIAWGAFLASGDTSYLNALVNQLELIDASDPDSFRSGADAMTLLAYQVPHHPLVRQTLESARKDSSPRTRKLINDLLTKDFAAVQQQLSEMQPSYQRPNVDFGLTTNPQGLPRMSRSIFP